MFGQIKPKINKKEHFIDESSKTMMETLTNLNNIFQNFDWIESLPWYISMSLVCPYNIKV